MQIYVSSKTFHFSSINVDFKMLCRMFQYKDAVLSVLEFMLLRYKISHSSYIYTYHGWIWYDGAHTTTITRIKLWSDFHSQMTPLMGELWGVFHELYEEKWPQYIYRECTLVPLTRKRLFLLKGLLVTVPGPWFNIKMLSDQCRKSHCGDQMI